MAAGTHAQRRGVYVTSLSLLHTLIDVRIDGKLSEAEEETLDRAISDLFWECWRETSMAAALREYKRLDLGRRLR